MESRIECAFDEAFLDRMLKVPSSHSSEAKSIRTNATQGGGVTGLGQAVNEGDGGLLCNPIVLALIVIIIGYLLFAG